MCGNGSNCRMKYSYDEIYNAYNENTEGVPLIMHYNQVLVYSAYTIENISGLQFMLQSRQ